MDRDPKGGDPVPHEEIKAVIRRFVAAADRSDFEEARRCLSPEIRVHLGGTVGPLDLATFFEFQGIPPTGKRITVTGIWIDRMVDGKIAERWGQVDMLGVMQQLGAISSPEQAGG
jgi:hypothetical protein